MCCAHMPEEIYKVRKLYLLSVTENNKINLNRHLDIFDGTGHMAEQNSKGSVKYRS